MKNGHGKLADWELLPAPDRRHPSSDRFIGLLNKDEDFNCIMLATLGLGDEAIQDATGLSCGQIHYRLRKAKSALTHAHLTRREFRRGRSPFARMLVSHAARFVDGKLLTHTLRALPDAVVYGKRDLIESHSAGG